jgi:hypothetical protein
MHGEQHTRNKGGGKGRRVIELIDGVKVLDGEGLMAHVTLLLLVVNVYSDIGGRERVEGCRRRVCGRRGMVIIGR